jgi:HD-GYP domain-containing protein (c-di-GMP phosphodiesterase class II)/pSer/pThr/pTyr-binding forkhead associated (FHA) protein
VSTPSIVLIGQSPEVAGLRWQSGSRLRIGRFSSDVDVVMSDATISPHHAEVVATRSGWVVRDLGSMHGTFLNDAPLNGRQHPLRDNDQLRFGRLVLAVKLVPEGHAPPEPAPVPVSADAITLPVRKPANANANASAGQGIKTTNSFMRVEASAQQTWEQAIDCVTGSGHSWQDRHMRALLRASYAVGKVASPDELLQSVLDDAVGVLEAQRGAILLADEDTGQLHLRALSLSRPTLRNRGTHSHTLAERCFLNAESLLCTDVRSDAEALAARSVTHGAMMSIICALLRTPRKRLGVLHLDRGPLQDPFSHDHFQLADALAATVSVGIESAQLVMNQRQQFVQTVAALGRAIEIRDLSTANHTNRVTEYALLLARELRVSPAELTQLQIGTPLHDIGKIGIADAILRKPGHLTPDEFEHMKSHTLKGAAILGTIPSLQSVVPIARHHHERWDGTGYPDGLSSDRIALVARIVAVADAFDAMTSDRPYRLALPLEQAFAELQAKAGSHFDPVCVRTFLSLRPQVEAICRRNDGNATTLALETTTLLR